MCCLGCRTYHKFSHCTITHPGGMVYGTTQQQQQQQAGQTLGQQQQQQQPRSCLNIHSDSDHVFGPVLVVSLSVFAGRPQPAVRWLINGDVVDDQYEHNFGDVIENRLMRPPLYRENLGAIFTCQAVNTLIVKPKESSYVLDMLRKY